MTTAREQEAYYALEHSRPCRMKRYWGSERLARNWRWLLALRYEYAERLAPYPCDEPSCGGWHLGPACAVPSECATDPDASA